MGRLCYNNQMKTWLTLRFTGMDTRLSSTLLRFHFLPVLNCWTICFFKQESQLVAGVAFKKTFSYAGFEMQPKKYNNPMIALLNVELELKAEKDNAEIRVHTVEVGPSSWQWHGNGPKAWVSVAILGQLCFSGSLWAPFSSCPPEYWCVHTRPTSFLTLYSLWPGPEEIWIGHTCWNIILCPPRKGLAGALQPCSEPSVLIPLLWADVGFSPSRLSLTLQRQVYPVIDITKAISGGSSVTQL